MCHKTTCRKCGKPTWAGCGNHIEQALAGIPQAQRCQGHGSSSSASSSSGGLFGSLFGR